MELVTDRGPEKSICPSEVARALGGEEWRQLMDDVRLVGIEMESLGRIDVMQKGKRVDGKSAKGPIRYLVR